MTRLQPITSVARQVGISSAYLESYGEYKAKVSLDLLDTLGSRRRGKYIDVTGITPTPLGEGKTVTTIGLAMSLSRLGKKAVACIREPSFGPLFGVKGGGTGGGRAQVVPADDINLHMTGDFHAASAAHNLAASFLDNHLFRGNRLGIDMERIFWRRVIDINDRSLRSITIGLGGGVSGVERRTGFDITAASEIMAILALSRSLADLRTRLSRIVVALTKRGRPITCADLKVDGAMAAILKDAIKPNLVQTSEGTPCFVHTGPFANITHGNSSLIADRLSLGLADYTVTESGFGADCGAEKFFDIKCRVGHLIPDAVVIVASVRALKMHSGRFTVIPGRPLDKRLGRADVSAVIAGCANLEKQIENVTLFGLPVVVALNRFKTDTAGEIEAVRKRAIASGAFDCVASDLYRRGSSGGITLARAVVAASAAPKRFAFLYPLTATIKAKIERIATEIYGARSVRYTGSAERDIATCERLGFGHLPVCMAKTHLSLSHDPHLKGRPRGFVLPVREVRLFAGAGFVSPVCGDIMTMPSLPAKPIGEDINIDRNGTIRGMH